MSHNREFIALVPLVNFNSDSDLIQLDDTLCLRRINRTELDDLINEALNYKFKLQHVLEKVEYVIEKRVRQEKKEYFAWNENSPYVRNIVLALGLFKRDYVYTPTAFLLDSSDTSFAVSNTSPLKIGFGEHPYFLRHKEIEAFVELWSKLQNMKEEKLYLRFPLGKFEETLHPEDYPYDDLLKYMLAFESIVFRRETEAPRPYGRAIGIAVGMLLGKNEKERTQIEKSLKRAYEIRDKLAHGHLLIKFDRLPEDYGHVESDAHEHLRRTLKKLLEE